VGTLPTAPSRNGHAFTEWNTEANGTGTVFTETTPVTADIAIYAQWQVLPPGSFVVTFDRNGGDTQADPQIKTVVPPATTVGTLPTAPSRSGYTFTEWNTEADGTGTVFTAATPVTADSTVYAQWQVLPPGAFVVTFDRNGGDTPANPQTKTVVPPATTVGTLPAPPARSGYSFTEWNTEADGTGTVFTAATPVTADSTVYAQWTPASAISLLFTDTGEGIFSQGVFILKRGGTPSSQGITVNGTWDSIEWLVDGIRRGTGTESNFSFTVYAAGYTPGGHSLNVIVTKDGVPWSKVLPFEVQTAVTGVSLNKTSLFLPVGGTETLNAVIQPLNATDTSLYWSSNAGSIATVGSGGLVRGVSTGTAVITVRTGDGGHFADCTIQVGQDQNITLGFNDQGSGLFTGDGFTLKKGGTPASQGITVNGTWDSIEWLVDGIRRDTGTGSGFTFTVYAADYIPGGHSLNVTVTKGGVPWSKVLSFEVQTAVTGVSLNKTSLILPVGGTETLNAVIQPLNATNTNLNWSSSAGSIATVNSSGLVRAVSAGTAVITVRTGDGGHSADCTIQVGQNQNIMLGFNADQGAGLFTGDGFTLKKGGTPASQGITVNGTWDSIEWLVDGIHRGSGFTFTVYATEYTPGGHSLNVTVTKGGVPWSKSLNFTVSN
jgi:uncharacterized repeat protein (TIGR02543 family)